MNRFIEFFNFNQITTIGELYLKIRSKKVNSEHDHFNNEEHILRLPLFWCFQVFYCFGPKNSNLTTDTDVKSLVHMVEQITN